MACFGDTPVDVIVFLLDDMRYDQVAVLEDTADRLGGASVQFTRAYATTPLCAPSRASLLSGGWAPSATGVLTNEAPLGGAERFADDRTLAVRLQAAGYATALFGKYLNGDGALGAYVPPGWTAWGSAINADHWTGFDVHVGSSTPDAPGTASRERWPGYVTDWQLAAVTGFLSTHPAEPAFVLLPFYAPHHPHEPAEADRGTFDGYVYRGGAFNEADVSDKPAWVRRTALWTDAEIATADVNDQERQESLLAVDRTIAAVVDAVRASPRGDHTVFIVTSDNGMLWGEHRLGGKGVGYEESVHVPLLVAGPGVPAREEGALVAMNLDVGATVQALAGLPVEGDGVSLVEALCSSAPVPRSSILLEGWPGDAPGWAGLVTARRKFLETATGERELYLPELDPTEVLSLASHPALAAAMAADAEAMEGARSLMVSEAALPDLVVGARHEVALGRYGGQDPVTWEVVSGGLPAGVTLTGDGRLVGVPAEAGSTDVGVRATDSSASPYDGAPQVAEARLTVRVVEAPGDLPDPGGCGCAARGSQTVPGGPAAPWVWLGGLALLRRRYFFLSSFAGSRPSSRRTRLTWSAGISSTCTRSGGGGGPSSP